MYVIFRDKVTNELIVKTLIDSEIAKRGIKVSEEDIKAEMKSIIDKVGSKEELNTILKQRGISNSEFTEDLKIKYLKDNDDELPENFYQSKTKKKEKKND